MSSDFSRSLCLLRQEKEVSQRTAAKELGISQALLSHYENGIREPGLQFVIRACDFYGVSSDFLLGRTLSRDGTSIDTQSLYDLSAEKDNVLHGSIMATLTKKLLVNTVGMLFDLLGKVDDKAAIKAASEFLGTAVYKLYRDLYRASSGNEDFFSVPPQAFDAHIPDADMLVSEFDFVEALAHHAKEKGQFPTVSHDALAAEYPGLYQSLLQIIHSTGERICRRISLR